MTATDNCDNDVAVTFNETTATPPPCPYPFQITRTWTATDNCDNQAVCTQIITVVDNTPPVLSGCPVNVTIECDEPVPEPATVTATDNCDPYPSVELVETTTQGFCDQEYTLTRTWTATDACGLFSQCVQVITVEDNTDPVCTVPNDTTIILCAPTEVCLPLGCTDNCDTDPMITIVGSPGSVIDGQWCYTPTGDESFAVTVRCEDDCGNFCEQVFNVSFVVNTAPVATCPENVSMLACDLSPICISGFECFDIDGDLASCEVSVGTLTDGTVCFTPNEGLNIITLTATDDCGLVDVCQNEVMVTLNSPPVCTPIDDIDVFQCEPTEVCVEYGVTDVDGNFDYCEIINGPGELVDGQWCYTPTTDASFTVTLKCYDECGATCQETFAVDIDINEAPIVVCPEDATIHWGTTYSATILGSDPDEGQAIVHSLGDGSPGAIDAVTGVYTFFATGEYVCDNVIMVIVTDDCNIADSCTFNVCVQNDPPTIACPDPILIGWGDLVEGTLTGFDPDGGPNSLIFTEVSFDGPGDLVVYADGSFEWQTDFTAEYTGTYTACVAVNDGAATCTPCSPENADTCCFTISVIPFTITIEKVHDVIQGQVWPVDIFMLNEEYVNYPIGGFDFLITYDPTALLVMSVDPGTFIDSCGWEYFTYRYGPNGNCGPGACPSGMLRIVAIAETNNGDNHPDCFTNYMPDANNFASINFLVTNDRTFECQYVPIRFIWYDCGDNALSSVTGDTLFISRNVYDYTWNQDFFEWVNIAATDNYPTLYGSQDCMFEDPNKVPYRLIDFHNGGIDIVCADSIDARGDINLNEIPYEIADAVVFGRYFVEGIAALHINTEGQVAATDVNADGIVLSVADLVYTIRVVVGDALAYPKITPTAVRFANNGGVLSVDERLGAAFVVVEGEVNPQLLADNMLMDYQFDGDNTRILVYSLTQGEAIEGEFLQVDGDVISVEMALYDGQPAVARLVPTQYVLHQSYPNPFNPATTLSFELPIAGEYSLKIFNVTGQQIMEFSGQAEVGTTTVEWNAGDNQASGVYFYRLTAGDFSATKKMILLK